MQSMADPALSKLGGAGLTRATAGCDATFLIKACFRQHFNWTFDNFLI